MRRFSFAVYAFVFVAVVSSQQPGPRGNPFAPAEQEVRRVFTTVGGRLEPNARTVHKTAQGGVVDAVFVSRGDRIAIGEPLFSVIQNEPGNRYRPVVVEARVNGTVSELLIQVQDEVNPDIPAVVILDTDTLSLEAAASDIDAFSIRTGIPVVGESPEGKKFFGLLDHVSAEPDYQTGLFTLTFTFPAAGGARIGMSLFIDLPVEEVSGIFVEPDAVVRRYGKNRIWLVSGAKILESRVVETGPVVGNKIQIVSGLEPGERYLRAPTGNEKEGMAIRDLFPDAPGDTGRAPAERSGGG